MSIGGRHLHAIHDIGDTLITTIWRPYQQDSVIVECKKKSRKCIYPIYGRDRIEKYLKRLDQLIQHDETANPAYEKKKKKQKAKAMANKRRRLPLFC